MVRSLFQKVVGVISASVLLFTLGHSQAEAKIQTRSTKTSIGNTKAKLVARASSPSRKATPVRNKAVAKKVPSVRSKVSPRKGGRAAAAVKHDRAPTRKAAVSRSRSVPVARKSAARSVASSARSRSVRAAPAPKSVRIKTVPAKPTISRALSMSAKKATASTPSLSRRPSISRTESVTPPLSRRPSISAPSSTHAHNMVEPAVKTTASATTQAATTIAKNTEAPAPVTLSKVAVTAEKPAPVVPVTPARKTYAQAVLTSTHTAPTQKSPSAAPAPPAPAFETQAASDVPQAPPLPPVTGSGSRKSLAEQLAEARARRGQNGTKTQTKSTTSHPNASPAKANPTAAPQTAQKPSAPAGFDINAVLNVKLNKVQTQTAARTAPQAPTGLPKVQLKKANQPPVAAQASAIPTAAQAGLTYAEVAAKNLMGGQAGQTPAKTPIAATQKTPMSAPASPGKVAVAIFNALDQQGLKQVPPMKPAVAKTLVMPAASPEPVEETPTVGKGKSTKEQLFEAEQSLSAGDKASISLAKANLQKISQAVQVDDEPDEEGEDQTRLPDPTTDSSAQLNATAQVAKIKQEMAALDQEVIRLTPPAVATLPAGNKKNQPSKPAAEPKDPIQLALSRLQAQRLSGFGPAINAHNKPIQTKIDRLKAIEREKVKLNEKQQALAFQAKREADEVAAKAQQARAGHAKVKAHLAQTTAASRGSFLADIAGGGIKLKSTKPAASAQNQPPTASAAPAAPKRTVAGGFSLSKLNEMADQFAKRMPVGQGHHNDDDVEWD